MTWDFRQRAKAFLRPGVRALYLGQGDPEWLLSSGHPFPLLCLALGPETLPTWQRALGSLGGQAAPWQEGALPFADGSFGLVLHRYGPCPYGEVRRVLRPGGFCLTEQLGARDSGAQSLPPHYNLENQAPLFQKAGFRIQYQNQHYQEKGYGFAHRFLLVGKAV